jgi:3-hydroxybutyryl-CoA dehydrogenase
MACLASSGIRQAAEAEGADEVRGRTVEEVCKILYETFEVRGRVDGSRGGEKETCGGGEALQGMARSASQTWKEERMDPKAVERVIVVGAGTMGNGIAQVFARAGIEVGMVDVDRKSLDRAVHRIESGLRTLVEHGSIAARDVRGILDRIRPSTDLEAAARGAGFAVEAVVEVPDVKRQVFLRLEDSLPEGTVIASNTSTLDVFSLAALREPGRLVVAHWFAPPHIIPLVEVVPGPQTAKEVVEFTDGLMRRIGKETVVLKEFVPSFIVNRLQNAIGMQVLEMLAKGWASPEEIDRAVKLTLGIRLPIVGVVQTLDFTGLDLVHDILRSVGMPHPLIDERVSRGHLGAKTGKGVYDYGGRSEAEILNRRDRLYLDMLDHLSSIRAFDPV